MTGTATVSYYSTIGKQIIALFDLLLGLTHAQHKQATSYLIGYVVLFACFTHGARMERPILGSKQAA